MKKRKALVDKAIACKMKGNKLFGKKKYDAAAASYSEATGHLWKFNVAEPDDVKNLRVACLSNLAQCILSLERYDLALKSCNDALLVNEVHSKTIYRRGVAYSHLNKLSEAKKDFHRALVLDPENKSVKKKMEKLKEKERLQIFAEEEEEEEDNDSAGTLSDNSDFGSVEGGEEEKKERKQHSLPKLALELDD